MFKKIFLTSFISFTFLFGNLQFAFAQQDESNQTEEKISISVFVRDDCRHCQDEEAFLEKLSKERNDLNIIYHNIGEKIHKDHFLEITDLEGLTKTTPITLVGNTIIQGFDSGETTGIRILSLIEQSKGQNTLDFEEYIAAGGSGNIEVIEGSTCDSEGICEVESSYLVTLPFFGVVDLQKYSLATLSVILGFVDGFNPCAMWVLVTFLIVLVQIGDRRKMLQIAGLFIIAEAVMYYMILNVWLTAWDFVGLDNIITPVVGVVSIGGAIFFLYEFWTSDGTCKVTSLNQRRKTMQKINDLVESPMTWITVFAVISLAFSVNIIEFACSIGIPQAFTKILNLNYLSGIERQVYLWIYTFFYMIDDFIVFSIALYSIEKIGITQKYARYCNLIGGIAMLILGGLLIFNPTALMF